MAKQFTYRGYTYSQHGPNGSCGWSWESPDGQAHGDDYPTDEACMDAIDAHKRAQRLAQSA